MKNFWNTATERTSAYFTWFISMLPQFILGALILILTVVIARKVTSITKKRVSTKAKNPLMAGFIGQIIRFIILLTGIVIVLSIIGLQGAATKILAGAGITAFVLGFAFKDIGENFLAGILLAFKSPFRMGDSIETDGITGIVESITMRETILITSDGRRVHIPNGNILKNPLFNNSILATRQNSFRLNIKSGEDVKMIKEKLRTVLNQHTEILKTKDSPAIISESLDEGNIVLLVKYKTDQKADKEKLHSQLIEETSQLMHAEDKTT